MTNLHPKLSSCPLYVKCIEANFIWKPPHTRHCPCVICAPFIHPRGFPRCGFPEECPASESCLMCNGCRYWFRERLDKLVTILAKLKRNELLSKDNLTYCI